MLSSANMFRADNIIILTKIWGRGFVVTDADVFHDFAIFGVGI